MSNAADAQEIALVDQAPPSSAESGHQPGTGHLHLAHAHRARFSTLRASYPLKLLAPDALPSQPANIALCYTLAYGGGLVAGDVVSLRVEVDDGCGLVMLTQGSTKVFKHRSGIRPQSHRIIRDIDRTTGVSGELLTRQRLHVTLGSEALLLLLPDSVSPFRDSRYSQTQRFVLPASRTASVIVLDWVNSGRGQRGPGRTFAAEGGEEVWAMGLYGSTNEVFVGDTLIMRERMVLDTDGGADCSRIGHRLAPYHVYATVLILGPHTTALQAHLQQLSQETSQMQVTRPAAVLWAYSQTDVQGGILRLAGKEVEEIMGWLRAALDKGGIRETVGDGLWPRLI